MFGYRLWVVTYWTQASTTRVRTAIGSSIMLLTFFKKHEDYFGTDLVNLNSGHQMTRTTPELARTLQAYTPQQWEDLQLPIYDLACYRPIYTGGSSVQSGCEPGSLRLQSPELTNRLSRPLLF
ncbi:hypothetical protein AVEN_113869-1 [Araneus ventricosus]|uniref:Uncharacterized protein n=1 Tax=Araneus ventricosus TaxID=182803 RepID=A0A4Y1ZLR9_ARAVE|nr:hypothetical protein AVEN_113869-1 [Araneus ventricosus]